MAFLHRKQLVFEAKTERSDPLFAKKLQELIGGQYGEMTIFMQYLFQGWNTRGRHEKYKDLIMDTGTEEIGHVELLATMVARLLDNAPVKDQEEAAKDPVIEAVLGGMNPQQFEYVDHPKIVGGLLELNPAPPHMHNTPPKK